jgi:hypothetical protein
MIPRLQMIPQTKDVRVAAVIEQGTIRPVWFERTDKPSRERIFVKQVTMTWDYKDGAVIRCHAIWDGSNTWQLSLNMSDFTWQLSLSEMDG